MRDLAEGRAPGHGLRRRQPVQVLRELLEHQQRPDGELRAGRSVLGLR